MVQQGLKADGTLRFESPRRYISARLNGVGNRYWDNVSSVTAGCMKLLVV